MNIRQFPKIQSTPPPEPPFPPAATGHVIDPDEKRLEVISFKAPAGTHDWLQDRASELGLTMSSYCLSLVQREAQEQGRRGQSGLPELLALVEEARREIRMAVADGRLSAGERARITRPTTGMLNRLWNRRAA